MKYTNNDQTVLGCQRPHWSEMRSELWDFVPGVLFGALVIAAIFLEICK
jgi:hypothetical protein